MIVVDTPRDGARPPLRIAVIGSCRVHMPISSLAPSGGVKVIDSGLAGTHSAAEALQSLQVLGGELVVPEALSPYVFDAPRAPNLARLSQTLLGGVDVFLLEISESRQFTCNGFSLQQNFLTRNLVQAHRGALLPWYREVCNAGAASADTVAAALDRMKAGGYRHDDDMAAVLRGVRLKQEGAEEIAAALEALKARVGGRWIIVGPFEVPDQKGAIMEDRRDLIASLKQAAALSSVAFHDASALVAAHGRALALDGGGADIYEYAPAFYPTVGEELVRMVRGDTAREPPSAPAPNARVVARIEAELTAFHRMRVEALGVDESGLYAHYNARLDADSIIIPRERSVADLIERYLPPYEAYAVLRAGIGELALLIAASGRRTIAYEPNRLRRGAIEAGATHLRSLGLIGPDALTVVDGVSPSEPQPLRTLGVGLDVVTTQDLAREQAFIRRLTVFDGLLVDLRTLFRLREEMADREATASELARIGFPARRDYPADGLSWFAKPAVVPRRSWWKGLMPTVQA